MWAIYLFFEEHTHIKTRFCSIIFDYYVDICMIFLTAQYSAYKLRVTDRLND